MANKTVYPFGTNGTLPGSIAIINDLVTGGADKALSAEMGKELGQTLKFTTMQPIASDSDKAIRMSDGELITGTNSVVKEYLIDPARIYYASGRQPAGSTVCAIGFYRGSTYIGHDKDGGILESAEDFVNYKLTIPAGTTIVKVLGNINYQAPILQTANSDILNDIENSQFVPQMELDTDTGHTIKKSDGTLASSQNSVIKTFKVIPGRDYFASGRQGTNTSYCSVAYYNEDTYISSQKDGGEVTSAEDFVKYKLTIPSTANIVKVVGNSGYQIPELFMSAKTAIEQLQERRFVGKKLAVIGDSISTIYGGNTPYWTVKDIDVGNTIQSYVTWEDVYGNYRYPDTSHPTGKTIGGVTLTIDMVDGELHSFTPVLADVGKQIGVPHHNPNNDASVKVWSQRLCEKTGMTLLANASWSGSAITSVETEARGVDFTASHAWHPCTIGRCRVRDDSGNFVTPDVIIIYRGTNDFSYGNNGNYPTLQISDVNLLDGFSATTDKVGDSTYNFRIGYYLTIKALREAYPNAIIYIATLNVFKRVHYDMWPTRNDAFTLPELNKVIREIADATGCGLIELDKDGITFENCYPTYIDDSQYTPTHPNGNGHRVMGEKAVADLTYALNPTA